jgi:hypothetical protein
MNPASRISLAITAVFAAALAQAQPVAPPTEGIDLGSMKLKAKSVNAATQAAPAGNMQPTPAPTGLRTRGGPGTQQTGSPAATTQAAPPAQVANNQTTTPTQTNQANQTNQTGVGNVVATPIGKRSAAEILGQSNTSKPEEKAQSNDALVKMPSMFKK